MNPAPHLENSNSSNAMVRLSLASKWFGNIVALNEVSLNIGAGLTGVLGPNGSGKTTMLRLISGLSTPSRGTIEILGGNPRENRLIYNKIGIMTDLDVAYEDMKGYDFLKLFARMRNLDNVDGAITKALNYVNMHPQMSRKISTYSRGMRQRIRLAAAILHDPQVLLLDEPLNGTDPRLRIEFQDLLRHFADSGKAVIVSSHILEELEKIADTVIVIVGGKLAAEGKPGGIRVAMSDIPYNIKISATNARQLATQIIELESISSISIDEKNDLTVLSTRPSELQIKLPKIAQQMGINITRVQPLDDSLESIFGYLVR